MKPYLTAVQGGFRIERQPDSPHSHLEVWTGDAWTPMTSRALILKHSQSPTYLLEKLSQPAPKPVDWRAAATMIVMNCIQCKVFDKHFPDRDPFAADEASLAERLVACCKEQWAIAEKDRAKLDKIEQVIE